MQRLSRVRTRVGLALSVKPIISAALAQVLVVWLQRGAGVSCG